MTAVADDLPRRRLGGRSARVRTDVHRAVVDLLRERAVDELTVPAVAERSGVHQATIYRRWGSVAAIVEDIVAAGPARTAPLPDTGTLDGDLHAYAAAVAETLAGPFGVLILRAAVSSTPRDGAGPSGLLVERTAQLQEMLDRAAARGEHPPTVDDLLEQVVAPLYFNALFGRTPGPGDARRLVVRLLTAPA